MMKYRVEWDTAKAEANAAKHGVTFDEAQTVFADVWALHRYDGEHSFDEERFIIIGMSQRERVLFVAYAERTQRFIIRIISARHATTREKRTYEEETRR